MATNKIAILVLAHKNQEQVIKLIDHLKTDFSIYLHIDRKSKIQISNENNVHSIKQYKVYWGSYNQILATRELMRIAAAGNHDRYLLISGQDLPIMSNAAIVQYFMGNNNNYLRGEKLSASLEYRKDNWRMIYYHFNLFDRREYNMIIERKLGLLQDIFKLYRKIPDNLYFGSNWFNLTHEAVMICLEKMYDKKYLNLFKYTRCADEVIIQSILYNSRLLSSIKNEDLRYADWSADVAYPKVLTMDDYDNVMNSAKLFARKFDDKIDSAVIDRIYGAITNTKS